MESRLSACSRDGARLVYLGEIETETETETEIETEIDYKTRIDDPQTLTLRSRSLPLHSRARPVLRPERAFCGRRLRSWYVLVRSFARSFVRSFARPHSLTRSPLSSAVIGIDLYALISTDVRPPF